MAKENIKELIYEETKSRLDIIEADDYEYPKKANKLDMAAIAVSVAASIVLIVLCCVGVIE